MTANVVVIIRIKTINDIYPLLNTLITFIPSTIIPTNILIIKLLLTLFPFVNLLLSLFPIINLNVSKNLVSNMMRRRRIIRIIYPLLPQPLSRIISLTLTLTLESIRTVILVLLGKGPNQGVWW